MKNQDEKQDQKCYTIYDSLQVGYTLEPIKCVHCNNVGEVVYNQGIGDGLCQICGQWQLD